MGEALLFLPTAEQLVSLSNVGVAVHCALLLLLWRRRPAILLTLQSCSGEENRLPAWDLLPFTEGNELSLPSRCLKDEAVLTTYIAYRKGGGETVFEGG